ncbi:hypothetical protein H311_03851, partial [Anncaliia algerae PRA109]
FTTKYILNMIYVALTCIISSKVTDFLHVPFTIIFYIINFGEYHTKLYFLQLLVNLVVIMLFHKSKGRTYFLLFINLITFGLIKHFSNLIDLDVKSHNNISIQFMLLVPKMYYISKEVIEIRYLFFLPSILAGPVIPLYDFIDRSYFEYDFKKILLCFIYGSILSLKKFITYEMLINKDNSFFVSYLLLFCYGFIFRSKYYFIWTFSSFCYSLCGLKVDNIDLIGVESARSMQEIMRKWNVYVNIWLKESIFDPMKKHGNFLAGFLTCLVSSMWHGFYVAYFLMFLSFSISVAPLKVTRKYYSLILSDTLLKVFDIFITSSLVSFFSVPFYFLDVERTMKVWGNVKYYGLFYVFASSVVFLIDKIVVIKKGKTE